MHQGHTWCNCCTCTYTLGSLGSPCTYLDRGCQSVVMLTGGDCALKTGAQLNAGADAALAGVAAYLYERGSI